MWDFFFGAVLKRTDDELDRQIALDQPGLEDGDREVVLQVHPPLAASRVTAALREDEGPALPPAPFRAQSSFEVLEEGAALACGLSLMSQKFSQP